MALASLAALPVQVPAPLTRPIGRPGGGDRRCAPRRPEVRLVTLTGPGGVGKTRLTLELAAKVADKFPSGVVFVPLAPVRDAVLVRPTIAQVLGIRGERDRSLGLHLAAALQDRQLLLVLDNLEHVLPAVLDIAEQPGSCAASVTMRS